VSDAPSLLGSYAKAVAGAAPLPGRPKELSDEHRRTAEEIELDREHVARYDRACGFRLRDTLPPTYLHVVGFPYALAIMTARSFPFGVLGLVHVENVIEHLRPVRVDETVDVRVEAQNLRDHESGRAVDLVAEARSEGELVWRGTSTYLRKGGGSGGGDGKKQQKDRPAPPRPNAIWTVPGDIGRRYADVSGDRNPIHLSGLSAKAFGMPGAIAHGMWIKARCLAALEGALPDAFRTAVQFKAPLVIPGSAAFATWREGDGRAFALHHPKSGKPHLTGEVTPIS
jgi:acyl dehydratase